MNNSKYSILNSLPAATIILDGTGKIIFRNKEWNNKKNLLCLTTVNRKNENYFEHCSKAIEEGNDYALRLLLGIRDVVNREKKRFRITINNHSKNPDKWFKVEVSPILQQSEKHVIIIFTDLSDEVKTIQLSRKSETLYRQHFQYSDLGEIFERPNGINLKENPDAYSLLEYTWDELFHNSPVAATIIDPRHKAKKVNKAFIDLFGYEEEELMGNNITSLLAKKSLEEEIEQINQYVFNGYSDQRMATRMKKDGTEVPVLLSTVPIKIDEKIIATYEIYVDLTKQVNLKNNLQKSLAEKDILLQESFHQLKNNLATIASVLQLQIVNS